MESNSPDQGAPTDASAGHSSERAAMEQDITSLGFPDSPTFSASTWAQSTDDLVPRFADSDQNVGNSTQEAIVTESQSSFCSPRNDLQPVTVSLEVKLADHGGSPVSPLSTTTKRGDVNYQATEVEMDELHVTLPPVGARWHSTEHLIHAHPLQEAKFRDERDPDTESDTFQDFGYAPKAPDYKPPSLRWPFQVFLLLLTAGVFAFFEYEMHHLPPVNFQLFEEHEGQANIQGATPGPQPAPIPSVEGPQATATGSWPVSNGLGEKIHVAIAAPDPTPDPRPPESLFPVPITPVTTHCGWSAPEWGINIWPYCTTFVVNGDCTQYEYWIRTFYTDDETWCPCIDESIDPRGWGEGVRLSPDQGANSHDTECHSIIRAIIHHNWYYRLDWLTGEVALDEIRRTLASVAALETPFTTTHFIPLSLTPTEPPWVYPSTDAAGSVLLPLFTRTYTSGYSFERFASWDYFDNPISTEGSPIWVATSAAILNNDASISPPAGLTWWTLPLSRPTSHAPAVTSTSVDTTTSLTSASSRHSSVTPTATSLIPSSDHASSPLSSITATPTSEDLTEGHSSTSSSSNSLISSIIVNPVPMSSKGETINSEKVVSTPATKDAVASFSKQSDQATSSRIKGPGTTTEVDLEGTTMTTADGTSQQGDRHTVVVPPVLGNLETSSFRDAAPTRSALESSLLSDNHPMRPSPSPRPAAFSQVSIHQDASSTDGFPNKFFAGPTTSETQLSDSFPETDAQIIQVLTTTTHSFFNGSASVITMVMTTTYHTRTADIESHLTSGLGSKLLPSPAPISGLGVASTANPGPILAPKFPPKLNPAGGNGPIAPGAGSRMFNVHSSADFLLASLIPVLVTTVLSMAIQVFVSSLNTMLPFRALTATNLARGAEARDSPLLARSSPSSSSPIYGPNISWRFLRHLQDPLALFNFLLSTISTIMVPLSNEVIHLELTTECDNTPFSDPQLQPYNVVPTRPGQRICAYGLRKQDTTMRVAESLLVVLAILIISMGFLLLRWRSGVAKEPWSVASMASLLEGSSGEFKKILGVTQRAKGDQKAENNANPGLKKVLLEKSSGLRFRLGYHDRNYNYGIDILAPERREDKTAIKLTTRDPKKRKALHPTKQESMRCQWLHVLKLAPETYRIIFNMLALVLTAGLLAVILYYEIKVELPIQSTGFERFMSGQSFQVRILFTALGTMITLFWDDYFSYISSTIIHSHLRSPAAVQSRNHLLHVSPPAHIFDLKSIYHTMFKTRDLSSLLIALATFLAKFTPILLSNIPFRNTITWEMHEVCTWMAVGVLSYMVAVLGIAVGAFFVRRARTRPGRRDRNTVIMPMDNIAGMMSCVGQYYGEGRELERGIPMVERPSGTC